MLLVTFGGVYADLDVYSTGPLTALWQCSDNVGFVAVHEAVLPTDFTPYNAHTGRNIRPTRVANYFFAAERGSPVLSEILATALRRVRASSTASVQDDVILTTGPDAMTDGFFGNVFPDALPARAVLANKTIADRAISHHARGGWRLQFDSFRLSHSYGG